MCDVVSCVCGLHPHVCCCHVVYECLVLHEDIYGVCGVFLFDDESDVYVHAFSNDAFFLCAVLHDNLVVFAILIFPRCRVDVFCLSTCCHAVDFQDSHSIDQCCDVHESAILRVFDEVCVL